MVIKESKANLSVKKKCAALEVNRSSYYKWQNKKPEKIDEYAETEINRLYHKHKGTYGRDRITQAMRNAGTIINHKKVYRIMCKLGLKAVIRKRWRIRKYIKENVACNTLNREFRTNEPLKKLVCDITELARVNDKRYYLFSIMDLYSNAIIASNISSHNDWGLVVKGLKKLPCQTGGVMLHSDQGPQFTSSAYRRFAEQNNIILSMSRVGNCYDNAPKESFFGHFKEEFYRYYLPKTREELYQNINSFLDYYNNERIQMRFKMSPVEYLKTKNGSRGFLSLST
jgi:transposase InsO family protein